MPQAVGEGGGGGSGKCAGRGGALTFLRTVMPRK